MKLVIALSTILASGAIAKESGLRSSKRELQSPFEDFLPGGGDGNPLDQLTDILDGLTGGDEDPLGDILDGLTGGDNEDPLGPLTEIFEGLTGGFESNMDLQAIQAMDPMVIGETNTFTGEDFLGITNCTGNITVILEPGVLTGLSTLNMDRFEVVQNTEQAQENFWTGLLSWGGTFDLLMTAQNLELNTGVTIIPSDDDPTCVPAYLREDDGSFSTGITMSMTMPVLEMMLNMEGSSPMGMLSTMFGGSQNQADPLSADDVSFTWESWTITFDNPNVDQTVNVTQVLEMAEEFLGDNFNVTDLLDMGGFSEGFEGMAGFEGFQNLENLDSTGITDFIQEATNAVAKSARGFTF